jgi:hypothetical protein
MVKLQLKIFHYQNFVSLNALEGIMQYSIAFLVRHAYKYVVKAVHRAFFPLFALVESPLHATGVRQVAQRKLLYLEKLFASLLIATPRIRDQLRQRVVDIQQAIDEDSIEDAIDLTIKKSFLVILKGLKDLLDFYLPAVFRIGYLVRCCTWEGRARGTGEKAKQILEEVLIILMHLQQDFQAKDPYVRTIAVALLTWQNYLSGLPGVCFAEESCEALLSRMSHRCESHRHLHGLEDTFNLFLTLPKASSIPKQTRGCLKKGLVSLFAARLRRVVFSNGQLVFCPPVGAKVMHSTFAASFPPDFVFPSAVPRNCDPAILERVLRHALRTLLGKATVTPEMRDFLDTNSGRRQPHEIREYELSHELQAGWFRKKHSAKPAAKPRAKRTLAPKPKARILSFA